MSTCVTIPFWPATLDCVRWSEDNLIAVAGSESVAILVPKLKAKPTDVTGWDYEIIKINTFTTKELPLMQPLSFANWSMGEETSLRYVQALEWSSPGLGNLDTSVLAIIHSDFAIDIWEYKGRPNGKENWRRCLMVTEALRGHYHQLSSGPEDQQERHEARQICSRVRSMAWAPQRMHHLGSLVRERNQQFLAVTTEAGHILLVRIISPHNILSERPQTWTATVYRSINCSSYIPELDRTTYSRSTMGDHYPVMEQLNWHYSIEREQHEFTFLVAGQVHTAHWRPAKDGEVDSEDEAVFAQLTPCHVYAEPPLKLTPDTTSIVYVADDAVVAQPVLSSKSMTQSLQRKWSDVAGLAVLPASDGMLRVYAALHLAYEQQQGDVMIFPGPTPDSVVSPGLQAALLDGMELYSRRLELAGGVQTHTWGIAASPSGRDIACCCTMLPADSVSHIIQSEQSCGLYIGEATPSLSQDILFDKESTESIVFALQCRAGAAGDDSFVPGLSDEEALVIIKRYVESLPSRSVKVQQPHLTKMQRSWALDVVYHAERLQSMQDRLLEFAQCRPYPLFMPTPWYLALMDSYETQMRRDVNAGTLSERILGMYRIVQQKLTRSTAVVSDVQERCSICDEEMAFEALKWSRCSSGHRFARCSLTFLAISQPGTSKSCGICGAQYLHEQRVPELDTINDESMTDDVRPALPMTEPSNSPARELFTAFYRCIFCNGRFVT